MDDKAFLLSHHTESWLVFVMLMSSFGCAGPTAETLEHGSGGPEHEPLRQQEERGREYAGRGPADGQRLSAEGRDGARARLHLLRAPHHPHQHLPHPTNRRGHHAHLHRWVCSSRSTFLSYLIYACVFISVFPPCGLVHCITLRPLKRRFTLSKLIPLVHPQTHSSLFSPWIAHHKLLKNIEYKIGWIGRI